MRVLFRAREPDVVSFFVQLEEADFAPPFGRHIGANALEVGDIFGVESLTEIGDHRSDEKGGYFAKLSIRKGLVRRFARDVIGDAVETAARQGSICVDQLSLDRCARPTCVNQSTKKSAKERNGPISIVVTKLGKIQVCTLIHHAYTRHRASVSPRAGAPSDR